MTMPMDPVEPFDALELELSCPAKVNLALSVGPPVTEGPKRGMHPIASWMAALDFGDDLRLHRLPADAQSELRIQVAPDAPRRIDVDWPRDKDLAWRALQRMSQHAQERRIEPHPVQIALSKRVPPGTGLGGGSADAAGVLIGLNRLWRVGEGLAGLMALGSELGSDVAFAVAAMLNRPRAVVTGLGEKVEPMGGGRAIHLTLLLPPIACPTGEVYRAFDALGQVGPTQEAQVRSLSRADPLDSTDLFNDLSRAAYKVRPELADFHRSAVQSLLRPVIMSGSGSACFVVAQDAHEAQRLAEHARDTLDAPALATRTL
jgi:4-diphosphocytidyl-2-C-methyl-D-erythritol kinase